MKLTKRDLLLNSALSLFSEQGIHSTSTASIAKHAGVANGTLFHHFENKQALVAALYVSCKQQLAATLVIDDALIATPLKQQVQTLWQISLDWAINNPKQFMYFQQVAIENALPQAMRIDAMKNELSILETMLTVGQSQGHVVDFPLDLLLDHCQSQILASGLFFINNPALIANQDYTSNAFELFWRAIAIEA
ncbi:MAG: TetR/AcrR family transcriptional regulator [Psychrobium sp.]